ncbi:hypothetical protein D3C71_1700800 [compost metagenome]
MLGYVLFQHILKILNRFDLRIAKLLQHAKLNLETAGDIKELLPHPNICRNRINGLVFLTVFHTIHVFVHYFFNMRSIFINKIGQVYDRSSINQLA